jgi:molecular chaperone HscB
MANNRRKNFCDSCGADLESCLACISCHTIFAPNEEVNDFDRLGLPVSFRIQPDELERAYLKLSRELHPDFFQLRSPEEQQQSLMLSAALNEAYATLKDPIRRAEYLLELRGGPSASECRDMPEGFFEHVLELRMEIEELMEEDRLESAEGRELKARLELQRQESMQQVAELFETIETSGDLGHHSELAAIRMELNKIKYLDGLLREWRTARKTPARA